MYGRGSGKDCRLHVQRLNEMRMKQEEECSEDLSAVPCVLDENARYNGEFICIIKTKLIITWCI